MDDSDILETSPAKVADEIARQGAKHVFGLPGRGSSLVIIDALEKLGVNFHLVNFSGVAPIMAGAVARLTGKAGVSISTKGPGLASAVSGLAACTLDSVPVVHIAEEDDIEAPKFHYQYINPKSLASGVSKGVRHLSHTGPSFSDMAKWAERECPAPVIMTAASGNLPKSDDEIPEVEEFERANEGFMSHISGSKKPLVIVGSIAVRKGWGEALEKLSVPVLVTPSAKGVLDETKPPGGGVYTGAGLKLAPETKLLEQADLVVGIGLRPKEVVHAYEFHCPSINIDDIDAEGSSAFGFAAVCGTHVFEEAIEKLKDKSWGLMDLASSFEKLRNQMLNGPFLPANVFAAVESRFGGRARMVMDAGYYSAVGEYIWRAKHSGLCMMSGQGRCMGTGIPTAIAASLQDPSVPTVLALGDGSIGMFTAELKMAVRYKLPLLVILMSDNSLGSLVSSAMKNNLSGSYLELDGRSWVSTFDAFGIPGIRAERQDSVESALKAWDASSGPAFIEVMFNSDDYDNMLNGIRTNK
ncbi:MAG: thiamine pyrophosphate-binding protein [Alphaproteobacteria bacterium]|nr:thiamine pyrophosphate-binding protein [Alphaproteobacteria bacterium]